MRVLISALCIGFVVGGSAWAGEGGCGWGTHAKKNDFETPPPVVGFDVCRQLVWNGHPEPLPHLSGPLVLAGQDLPQMTGFPTGVAHQPPAGRLAGHLDALPFGTQEHDVA